MSTGDKNYQGRLYLILINQTLFGGQRPFSSIIQQVDRYEYFLAHIIRERIRLDTKIKAWGIILHWELGSVTKLLAWKKLQFYYCSLMLIM